MVAGTADWSIAVGIFVFIIAIIFAAYYYFKYGKIFLVIYAGSVATYVFSVFYIWDVYELQRNGVLILLVLSTIVMMYLGRHFSKIKIKPSKMHTSLKEKE